VRRWLRSWPRAVSGVGGTAAVTVGLIVSWRAESPGPALGAGVALILFAVVGDRWDEIGGQWGDKKAYVRRASERLDDAIEQAEAVEEAIAAAGDVAGDALQNELESLRNQLESVRLELAPAQPKFLGGRVVDVIDLRFWHREDHHGFTFRTTAQRPSSSRVRLYPISDRQQIRYEGTQYIPAGIGEHEVVLGPDDPLPPDTYVLQINHDSGIAQIQRTLKDRTPKTP
jgi:hypothetical protein